MLYFWFLQYQCNTCTWKTLLPISLSLDIHDLAMWFNPPLQLPPTPPPPPFPWVPSTEPPDFWDVDNCLSFICTEKCKILSYSLCEYWYPKMQTHFFSILKINLKIQPTPHIWTLAFNPSMLKNHLWNDLLAILIMIIKLIPCLAWDKFHISWKDSKQ